MHCPKPLIETKRAINSHNSGDILTVIVDNDTSLTNLKKFLIDNGLQPSYDFANSKHLITFTIGEKPLATSNPQEYCITHKKETVKSNLIVVLSTDTMGSGNDELGQLLMKGFLTTLAEMTPLPEEIICYNSGVKLAMKGTPSSQNLLKLVEMGVKITLCGTCVDFFGIKNTLDFGEISNMYYIVQRLTSSAYILKP